MDVSRRQFLAAAGLATAAAALPSRLLAEVQRRTPPMPALSHWSDVRGMFALEPGYLHFTSFFLVSHPRPVREAIDAMRATLDANPLLAIEKRVLTEDATGVIRTVTTAA